MARVIRIEGVDLARGIASVLMLQGHAFHGWASASARESAAYGFTRVLGTFPLPAFLVLAGASLALRVHAAETRREDASSVRRAVVRRGLVIVFAGYLTSTAMALMDGSEGLATLLRSDVLHVIGLSLVLFGLLGIRSERGAAPHVRTLGSRSLTLGLVLSVASPWVNRITPLASGGFRYLAALFGDVPGVTRMPLFPLGAWMALGVGLGLWLLRAQRTPDLPLVEKQAGGTPRHALLGIALCAALAWSGQTLTHYWAASLDHPLSRADVAVWANLVDLGARGSLVLFLGVWCSPWLPRLLRQPLLLLGRYSLWAYVFHLPFCYGRLAMGARGSLSTAQASLGLLALGAASLGVVWLRRRVDVWRAERARLRPSAGALHR